MSIRLAQLRPHSPCELHYPSGEIEVNVTPRELQGARLPIGTRVVMCSFNSLEARRWTEQFGSNVLEVGKGGWLSPAADDDA